MPILVSPRRSEPVIDARPVLLIVGLLVVAVGIAMLLPGLVGLGLGSPNAQAFIGAATITVCLGGLMVAANRVTVQLITRRQTYILTVLAWLVVPGFAALPFTFSDLDLSYTDAYFESMSGFTTTGSTVLVGLDQMDRSILLWRALISWLGGIGIIVMAMAILPLLRTGGMQLFHAESSDRYDKPFPRATQFVSALLFAYVVVSAACALAYWLAGMTAFDAVTHMMATLATGGFSTHDASFAYFRSPLIEWLGVLFMLSGALPFVLYVRAARGDAALLRDRQVQLFLGIVAISSVVLAMWLAAIRGVPFFAALRLTAFNVTSVITTTGFASADYNLWGGFAVGAFFYLTLIGGCTGSTAGGIKIFRFRVMGIVLADYLLQRFYPHGVGSRTYDGRPLEDDVVEGVLAFAVVYAGALAAIALGLGACDLDWLTSLSGAATALGNVGPGLGPIIGPAGNFASLPDAAKWLLSFGMMFGRLELFTVLVLLVPRFWRG
ncbi:MAG: TrkH family potassium uptake protein [Geminicoccaceae bacterium]